MANNDATVPQTKEERILSAAAEVFRSPSYDVFSDLQYKAIAERAHYSTRTVRDAFANDVELKRKVVEYMLDEETRAQDRPVDTDEIADALNERSRSLVEIMIGIGAHYVEQNLTDPMMRSQMALWPYAKQAQDGNDGSRHIADCLLKGYKTWDSAIEGAVSRFLVDHSDVCVPVQSWISSREFGILATALAEGLSIRATLDPSDVPHDLAGKALLTLLATLFDCPGERGSHDGHEPEVVAELDRRRAASLDRPEP